MSLPFLTYRGRLLLLVLLAVIPAFALMIDSAWEERSRAEQEAKRQNQQWAALIALEQRHIIDQARQLLATLSSIPVVRDAHMLPRCQEALAEIRAQNPHYANIGMVDAEGNLLCSAIPFTKPLNFAHRAWYRRASETRDFAVGDYQIGQLAGVPVLTVALSLQDESGNMRRVIFAALDLSWFESTAQRMGAHPGVVMSIADGKDIVLARYPDPQREWIGKPAPEGKLPAPIIAAGCQGSMQFRSEDGHAMHSAIEPMLLSGNGCVHVRVSIPDEQILAPSKRQFQRNLWMLLIITCMIFAIAWFSSDWLVLRRLRALIGATRRVEQGDLTARTSLPHAPDEFGQMARSFDEMAAGLEEREKRLTEKGRALTRSNRALTVLSFGNRTMLHAVDEATLLNDMCHIAVDKGGYLLAWGGYVDGEDEQNISIIANVGPVSACQTQLRFQRDEDGNLCAYSVAIRERRPVVSRDIARDPLFVARQEEALRFGLVSCIALPLMDHDKVFGILNIYSTEPDAFDGEEVALLNEFASDLAFGIARLRDKARRQEAEVIEDLYNQAPCGYHSIDAEGRFLRINDTELDWLGYAREELVGPCCSTC